VDFTAIGSDCCHVVEVGPTVVAQIDAFVYQNAFNEDFDGSLLELRQ
jgi:hypothetical protein